VTVILQNEQPSVREILTTGQSYIQDLAKVESLTITNSLDTEIEPAIAGVIGTVQVLIPLAGVVAAKRKSKVEAEANRSQEAGQFNFVDKAPPEVVEELETPWQKLSSSGNFAGSAARFSITKGNATSSSGAKNREFQAR